MRHGDQVRCTSDGIDTKAGKGLVGTIAGFGKFSTYHPPEVWVEFEDNPTMSGWFWKRDIEPTKE